MQQSALWEVIQALHTSELKEASRWVESPAFNRKKTIAALYEQCVASLLKKTTPTKAELCTALETEDEKQIRRDMSELLDILYDFLAWKELARDPAKKVLYQTRAIRRRGLDKNYGLVTRQLEKAQSAIGEASLFKYQVDFQADLEKYEWESAQKRGLDFPFAALSSNLNAWYAAQLMQLACMAQAQGAVHRQSDADFSDDWVLQVVQSLPDAPQENRPAVTLFYLGHAMLSKPEDAARVDNFRLMIEKNIAQLPADEAKGLLMLAINHGIRRINEGDKTAISRTLDFYLLGIERGVLLDERGYLPKYSYNNVLMTFLALQKWEEALAFLAQYRSQLPPAEQENVYRYNLAIYHFRRGEFDLTLDLLRDVWFPDPMYNLESRKMLLKIYYEQSAFDALESLLSNLLTWLRRHPEIGYHREMYRNLAVFTGQLLRLPLQDKEARKRLKKKVEATKLVAERSWLLGKIGE